MLDCDLQDPPGAYSEFFKNKKFQTIHFVRKKREDSLFQRFYSRIAYLVLHFISGGKIIMNSNFFIIPPVKKVKSSTEIYPFWHYLFTKYSTKSKIIYYIRKKRMFGSSHFTLFSFSPWQTFFSATHCFRERFVNTILILLTINIMALLFVFYKFFNIVLILLLLLFIFFLIGNLLASSYYKLL